MNLDIDERVWSLEKHCEGVNWNDLGHVKI